MHVHIKQAHCKVTPPLDGSYWDSLQDFLALGDFKSDLSRFWIKILSTSSLCVRDTYVVEMEIISFKLGFYC